MLDPEPDREGLGLDGPAARREALVELAGAVSRGEDESIAGEGATIGEDEAAHATLDDLHVGRAGVPHERAAAALQLLAHGRHRGRQDVGPDVRLALDLDPLRVAEAREELDHLANGGMTDAGGELPVGVRAGAPLAEVHVRLGVEGALAHEPGHVAASRAHRLAAVDHDRTHAPLEESPGTEEPGRPGSEDDRREVGRAHRRRSGLGPRNGLDARREGRQFARELDLRVDHPAGVPLLAGVEGATGDREAREVAARHAQALGDTPLERVRGLVEPEVDAGNAVAHGGRI